MRGGQGNWPPGREKDKPSQVCGRRASAPVHQPITLPDVESMANAEGRAGWVHHDVCPESVVSGHSAPSTPTEVKLSLPVLREERSASVLSAQRSLPPKTLNRSQPRLVIRQTIGKAATRTWRSNRMTLCALKKPVAHRCGREGRRATNPIRHRDRRCARRRRGPVGAGERVSARRLRLGGLRWARPYPTGRAVR